LRLSVSGSFLVEEFINSITVQLDRVQDSLRLKSLNRPLTYALKDFALDLQVFVELDGDGHVRFRNSAPNEAGASSVRLGFTTITKPMIEENTVSLAVTRSPSLEQIGLEPDERKKLEQLGVRNASQLQTLYSSTGARTVQRLTDVPLERLRQALHLGTPQVSQVTPVHAPPPVAVAPPAVRSSTPGVIRVAPGTPHLNLQGSGLIGASGPAIVRLNRQPLSVAHADDEQLIVNLPDTAQSGALEVTMPDGNVLEYRVVMEARSADAGVRVQGDRWEPSAERT